jgi:glycosyltransferase involved in cell wall biosynthesis
VAQAISYFLRQDYPERELVVVDDGAETVADLIPNDPQIQYARLPGKRSVGAKRNRACEMARGEIIVHWDDDDWMAPWRLSRQVQALLHAPAMTVCGLARFLLYQPSSERAWMYEYPRGEREWVYGATFCYRKATWEARGFPDLNQGEDTAFLWNPPNLKVLALKDYRFYVAIAHQRNTVPKRTDDGFWRAYPGHKIRELLQDDWSFYAQTAAQSASPPRVTRRETRSTDASAATSRGLPVPPANVSCLMVTKDRLERFREAYQSYCAQDYHPRGLVVVTDGTPAYQQSVRDHIVASRRNDVRLISLDAPLALGELRNISVAEAQGPLLCQWDDDDLCHPRRLTLQVNALLAVKARVSYLADQLQFFADRRELYWSDWNRISSNSCDQLIPGTLLAFKDDLPRYESNLRVYEDSALCQEIVKQRLPIARVHGLGYLFIYIYHGKNAYDRSHHLSIARRCGLSVQELRERADLLTNYLGAYPLKPPVTICGASGKTAILWNGYG